VRVERIEADYFIETAYDVRKAVEAMAGEQSSGTFLPVPGETPELKARSAARVEDLEALGEADQPSLPGSGAPHKGRVRLTARATLSWPLENIGPSLPNLMAAVAGNLFELEQFSGLRILDIRLPDAFARAYPGPKFGVEGTRNSARSSSPRSASRPSLRMCCVRAASISSMTTNCSRTARCVRSRSACVL
jgi:ribulose-bisphosphate carboxylase large chain